MTALGTPRYTVERTDHGWDIVDTEKGVSVGTCPTEKEAGVAAQQLNAFLLANAVRLGRSALRRETTALGMLEARERVADLLLEAPREIHTVKVLDLLMWVPRVGRSQGIRIIRSFCAQFGWDIAENRRIVDMTERQRVALANYLRGERVERTAA